MAGLKTVQLIQGILQCGVTLWKQRNIRAHTSTDNTENLTSQKLRSQIAAAYAQRHRLHPAVQFHMFQITEEEMVHKPIEYKKMWLTQVTPILSAQPARAMYQDSHIEDFACSIARPPGSP